MTVAADALTTTDARPGNGRWSFALLVGLLALALGTSGAPAPLYGIYAQEWHFAPLTTTIVFAVYAVAALAAVLVTGAISDRVGRKPVLLVALGLVLVGLVLFMLADNVAYLLAARALHGLGVGATVVAATAALLDLRPDHGERTGMVTGVAFNVGIGLAILGAATIADVGPDPMVLPYAILTVLAIVVLVGVVRMPETHREQRAERLHIARPHVPSSIAAHFRFSALGVMASWSVLGVFLSLFPSIASQAVGATHVLFGGAVVAVTAIAAAASQAVSAHWRARRTAIVGDVGTGLSLLLAIAAIDLGNGWLIAVVSGVLGATFGLAFGGSLRHLTHHVPAEHRGEVMSAFYVLAYGAMAVPTVVAGWAATVWSPDQVFAPFLVVVALACMTAGALGVHSARVAAREIAPTS